MMMMIIIINSMPQHDQGLLNIEASRSHSEAPNSAGLLWTGDKPDALISA